MVSVLLHGLLAGGLMLVTLMPKPRPQTSAIPLPIEAVVVDSQVLHAVQKAQSDRAEEEAARARAAAEAKAAAEAAAAQQRADAAAVEAAQAEAARTAEAEAAAAASATAAAAAAEQQKLADAQKTAQMQKTQAAQQRAEADKAAATETRRVADAKRQADAEAKAADDARRAAQAKQAADAKAAPDARAAADAKASADAKRVADDKARKEGEAELRRQMADEERVSAVESGPLRDRYITLLRNKIQNAWIKPPSATAGVDCQVQVTQVAGGEVTAARVTQCNGDAAVRQSIENAVYRASPLPDPPDPALFERNFVLRFKPNE